MSDAPTSGREDLDPAALARAGWSEEDLAWERLQEEAATREEAGDRARAAALWAEALRVAREGFEANDPRLAASLTNHAVALGRAGEEAAAKWLFEEALLVWDSCAGWLDAMRPERRARSSLFHLRLEVKNRAAYAANARARARELVAEGRARTLALRDGGAVDAGEGAEGDGKGATERLMRWRAERPAGPSDTRKLLAASLLIAGSG